MRSKTGYFSGSAGGKAQTANKIKALHGREAFERKVIELIYRVGPWRLNHEKFAAYSEAAQIDEILASIPPLLGPDWEYKDLIRKQPLTDAILYYPIGSKAFIFVKNRNKSTLDKQQGMIFTENVADGCSSKHQQLARAANLWRSEISAVLHKIASSFQTISIREPRFAEFSEIEDARRYLPDYLPDVETGRCLHHGEVKMLNSSLCDDLYVLFRFGLAAEADFWVFALDIPDNETSSKSDAPNWSFAEDEDNPATFDLAALLSLDYQRCRLPELAPDILTDNTQGHWDLYWPAGRSAPERWYQAVELEIEGEARNPVDDIQKSSVGIDFGTASTVVAVRDRRGRISLVRVGADDFKEAVSAKDYENPTALLFENLEGLQTAWNRQPWRPLVSWDHVKCSHQAVADAASKMAAFLDGLKTWAKTGARPVTLKDCDNGAELTLSRSPEAPEIDIEADFAESPLNPVELYAWFIGLRLNNQVGRSEIYTDYHLTFPAGFDRNTRDFILASFRRGLLRSLPASMIYGAGWDYAGLRVREAVSEPAAYAAAALAELDESKAIVVERDDPAQSASENHGNARKIKKSDSGSKRLDPRHLFAKLIQNADDRAWTARAATAIRLAREKGHLNLAANLEEIIRKVSTPAYGAHDIMPNIEAMLHWLPGADPEVRTAWENLVSGEERGLRQEDIHSSTKKAEKPIPTEAGVPFGIFDFGGGTADFAIGLYRLPTRAEADLEGWQEVVEILETGSDIELGGENLLAKLAFFVAGANLPALLKEDAIPFAPPLDEPPVPGGEEIFVNTVIARANTRKLMEILRPFWEGVDTSGENRDQLTETFRTATGKEIQLNLACNWQQMRAWLEARITAGVGAFFSVYRQALGRLDAKHPVFHILLAGNASQHPQVLSSIRKLAQEQLAASNQVGAFHIHPPVLAGKSFSAKTGVAIGILKSLPGETTGIVSTRPEDREASFQYCVWPLSGISGKDGLIRGCEYGKWVEFSRLNRAGRLIALYSSHPAAREGKLKRGEGCLEEVLEWPNADAGRKVFVKAQSPRLVVFALAAENGDVESEITLELEDD